MSILHMLEEWQDVQPMDEQPTLPRHKKMKFHHKPPSAHDVIDAALSRQTTPIWGIFLKEN